jgi:hypothetical protein
MFYDSFRSIQFHIDQIETVALVLFFNRWGGTVLVDGSGMNGGSNPEAEILPGSFRTFGEASDANVFFLLFLFLQ